MTQFKPVLGMFLGGILFISSFQATASPEPVQRKYHKLVYANLILGIKNYDLIMTGIDGFMLNVSGKKGHVPELYERATRDLVREWWGGTLDQITIANTMLTALKMMHDQNGEKLTDADYRDIINARNYFGKAHKIITSQCGLIDHKVLHFRDVSMGEEALALIQQGRDLLQEVRERAHHYAERN